MTLEPQQYVHPRKSLDIRVYIGFGSEGHYSKTTSSGKCLPSSGTGDSTGVALASLFELVNTVGGQIDFLLFFNMKAIFSRYLASVARILQAC